MKNHFPFNFKSILLIFKYALILILLVCIPICIISFFDNRQAFYGFLFLEGIALLFIGLCQFLLKHLPENDFFSIRDGFLTILLVWGSAIFLGSIPFFIGIEGFYFIDAIFESTASWSTNGITLYGSEQLSFSLLLWRASLQWMGGFGIILLIISFVPSLVPKASNIFFFDKNSSNVQQINPSTQGTALRLFIIYSGLTVSLFFLLLLQHIPMQEAILLTLSTISTAGLNFHQGDVSSYSFFIQLTLLFFMIISSSNIYLLYFVLKMRWKLFIENDEIKWYFLIAALAIASTLSYRFISNEHLHLEDAFKVVFNLFSVISTTGFYIPDISLRYDLFMWFVFVILMAIGSTSASTAGGISLYRFIVLFRTIRSYVTSVFHPSSILKVSFNKKVLPTQTLFQILTFSTIYLILVCVSIILLTLSDIELQDAITLSVGFISNTGNILKTMMISYDFSSITAYQKILFSLLMFAGKMQIIPLLIIVSPVFWKK
ncbi:MAG: hypothetical protein N2Z72_00955 [Bacteroidales bacterium]|nr:hypothetical protein [Bacteroidales bacterium]